MQTARSRQFKSLLERVLQQPLMSDEMIQAIVDLVARCMGLEVATLYAYDRRADELLLVATRGLARSAVGYVTLKLGQGMSGRAALERRPISTADVRAEAQFLPIPAFDQHRFLSLLAVPVLCGNDLVGALNVQTLDVHQFHQREMQELGEIADLLAPRLALLWRSDLAARLRGPSALSRLDGFLSTNADPSDVARRLAEQLQTVFPMRQCTVALRIGDGRLDYYGDDPDSGGRAALAALASGCNSHTEVQEDEAHGIGVPLCDGPKAMGAFYLGLGDADPEPLSSAASRVLESLASQVCTALARAAERRPTEPGLSPLENAYDNLIRLVLDDAGLDALLAWSTNLCNATIAVTDTLGALVAGTMPEPIATNVPLKAGDVVLGRLLASRPLESVPAMTAVARAVSIELSKWKVRFDVERDLRGDALESLLAAPNDPRETATRARLIGIDPERAYTPVLFAFDVASLIEKHGAIVLRSVLSTLQRVFGAAPASASFVREEGILSLVQQSALWRGSVSVVGQALEAIRQAAPDASISAGIGPSASGPPEYTAAIRQARLAADLGARLDAVAPIDSSQIGAYRLLVGIEDPRRLTEFVAEYLGPLVDHDSKRGTDFVRTLEAYHACGERLQPTASLLFVHVNTLKHRLRRIAALSSRNLDNVSDRFNMYLALYALRLVEPDRHSLLPSGFANVGN